MNIPKISIPKIDMASVKQTAKNAIAKGADFVKTAPGKLKGLAHDTADFVKTNPKKAGVYAFAGLGALALLNGIKGLVKAGVEKVQARKSEE